MSSTVPCLIVHQRRWFSIRPEGFEGLKARLEYDLMVSKPERKGGKAFWSAGSARLWRWCSHVLLKNRRVISAVGIGDKRRVFQVCCAAVLDFGFGLVGVVLDLGSEPWQKRAAAAAAAAHQRSSTTIIVTILHSSSRLYFTQRGTSSRSVSPIWNLRWLTSTSTVAPPPTSSKVQGRHMPKRHTGADLPIPQTLPSDHWLHLALLLRTWASTWASTCNISIASQHLPIPTVSLRASIAPPSSLSTAQDPAHNSNNPILLTSRVVPPASPVRIMLLLAHPIVPPRPLHHHRSKRPALDRRHPPHLPSI